MNDRPQAKESWKRIQQRLGLRHFSTVELLIALALLFLFFPFVEEMKGGNIIMSILFSLVLLSAVLAVGSRRRTLIVALLLPTPAVGADGLPNECGETIRGNNKISFEFL